MKCVLHSVTLPSGDVYDWQGDPIINELGELVNPFNGVSVEDMFEKYYHHQAMVAYYIMFFPDAIVDTMIRDQYGFLYKGFDYKPDPPPNDVILRYRRQLEEDEGPDRYTKDNLYEVLSNLSIEQVATVDW